MYSEDQTAVPEQPETKTVISVNLTAQFDTLEDALELVASVKDLGITSFNISQYERYEGDIPF